MISYRKLRQFLVAGILVVSLTDADAQRGVGFLAGTGIIYYNGDLNEKSDKIISPTKVIRPMFRVGACQRIFSRAEISFLYMHGTITSADSLAIEKDNRARNQSFKSAINEVSFNLELSVFKTKKKSLVNPFVSLGAGIFHFNPKAKLNDQWYELQPLGTEGQYITESAYEKPYKLTQLSLPIGIGVNFQLSDQWRLRIDYGQHFTTTDHLDDVSTVYPDSTLLAATPNGALAVLLSNRRLDSGFPTNHRNRGNAKHNDSYSHVGVSLIYNPVLKKGALTGNQARFSRKMRAKVRNSCSGF